MNKPKISFVVTARNDNYGGNLLNRASTFVRVLSYLVNKYKLPTEIIWVEYNPVSDKKFLFEELQVEKTDYMTMRNIIVPKSFHNKVKKNNIPLLEYVAKNIGIRRANGEYIVATNPDVIMSEEIIKNIATKELNPEYFYRADRNDIFQNSFPPEMAPKKILEKARKCVTKILYTPRTHYISYFTWLNRIIHDRRIAILSLAPFFNYRYPPNKSLVYENASGDFTMAHKDVWKKAHGYDETPHNLHHDSFTLYVFKALGFRQEIFPEPIYHIHHELGRAGRPGIEFAKYRELTNEMQETGIPIINNDENWGFVKEKFEERTISGEN